MFCRNRCFRCLFSSKAPAGSVRPLGSPFQLSGRYPPTAWMLPAPSQWLWSLVCHTPSCAKLLQFSAKELSAVASELAAKPMMLPPPAGYLSWDLDLVASRVMPHFLLCAYHPRRTVEIWSVCCCWFATCTQCWSPECWQQEVNAQNPRIPELSRLV